MRIELAETSCSSGPGKPAPPQGSPQGTVPQGRKRAPPRSHHLGNNATLHSTLTATLMGGDLAREATQAQRNRHQGQSWVHLSPRPVTSFTCHQDRSKEYKTVATQHLPLRHWSAQVELPPGEMLVTAANSCPKFKGLQARNLDYCFQVRY